jgi:hypothetical protein
MYLEQIVDLQLLLILFLLSFTVLWATFKNYIHSVVDPLVQFLVWTASVFSAGSALFVRDPTWPAFLTFILPLPAILVFFLLTFQPARLSGRWKRRPSVPLSVPFEPPRMTRLDWVVMAVLFSLVLFVVLRQLSYVLEANLESIVAGRFYLYQERKDPFDKIVNVVVRPMVLAQGCRLMLFSQRLSRKAIAAFLMAVVLGFAFLLGARSIMLLAAIILGATLFVYRRKIRLPKWSRSQIAFFSGSAAFVGSVMIGTAGAFQVSLRESFYLVTNRILLAGDGLLMWGVVGASVPMNQSILSVLNFIFGQFFGTLSKNFGWILYETFTGQVIPAAYGPNFIFPLQFWLAGYFAPLWFFAVGILVVLLRKIQAKNDLGDVFRIVLSAYAFLPLQDAESAAFIFGFIGTGFALYRGLRLLAVPMRRSGVSPDRRIAFRPQLDSHE